MYRTARLLVAIVARSPSFWPCPSPFTMELLNDNDNTQPEPITLDAIECARARGKGEVLPDKPVVDEGDPNKLMDFYLED